MVKKIGPIEFIKSLGRILAGKPKIPASQKNNPSLNLILNRRSVRVFSDREIPGDVFEAIMEAGRLAPSTVNLQTWSFSIFNRDTWKQLFNSPIPFRAKRAVIILADTHREISLKSQFPPSPLFQFTVAVMNASLAAMNMNNAAESMGVSSVMLSETGRTGLLDAGFLKERLLLPEGVFPLTTIVFGYAKGLYPPMPPKLPLEVISFPGRYREVDQTVMEEWLSEMIAGYKAMRPLHSFEAQLKTYSKKIRQAEADLMKMVFPQ